MTARLTSLLFVLFSAMVVQAQETSLSGTVQTGNGDALEGAHIIDIASRKATITDSNGAFQLSVADSGAVLRVSHVGYRPMLDTLTTAELQQNLDHSIFLTQESTLLTAAVVSARDLPVIKGRRGLVLRDLLFLENTTLLLAAEWGVRYLMLMDEHWDELARIRVDDKGESLFEDCLGNAHLLGNDTVHQVIVTQEGLRLDHATESSYFEEQMAHCRTSTDSHIFFSSYQKAGQEVFHYGLHRKTKEGVMLSKVFDHVGLRDIHDYFSADPATAQRRTRSASNGIAGNPYFEQRSACLQNPIMDDACRRFQMGRRRGFRNISPHGGAFTRGPQSSLLRGYTAYSPNRHGNSAQSYFNSVPNALLDAQFTFGDNWQNQQLSPRDRAWRSMLEKPTYSPLFKLRDSIYVFDHVLGICTVHDADGRKIRSFVTEHQELNGWDRLVSDADGERLYARQKKGSTILFHEMDLTDGSILRTSTLKDARYAHTLRIRNGYLYYVSRPQDVYKPDSLVKKRL